MTRFCTLLVAATFTLAMPALAQDEPPAIAATNASADSPPETAPHAAAASPPIAETAQRPRAAATALHRPAGRELGGHVFMPVLGIVGPFATTSFGTFLTMGAGSTHGSVTVQIPGSAQPETFGGKVSYAAVGGVLGFEYAFLRNFSARALITETLYSGTTGAAAAVIGTNARLGGGLGLTAGLPIGNSVRVAGVFDVNYAPRFGLLLGPAIHAAFDSCSTGVTDCRFDLNKLFQQQNVLRLTPGLAAAWTPTKPLGITGNVSYAYSSIDTKGSGAYSEGAMSFGAAVDFDFHAFTSVPVGLQALWNTEATLEKGGIASFTDLGGGMFYTGREELALGLQAINRRFRVVPEVDVSWNTVIAMMGLRYYWRQ
ncbi:MAG TPA: hypothetical protein VFK05_12085 [Polyangiaceae bacterium]|nr:hypothetical protein [Polyangiaceae bacterium]